MPPALDPVAIARDLIRCRSVTPADDGCLRQLQRLLLSIGFEVDAFTAGSGMGAVANLIARRGTGQPVLAFAGHTDVVPAGDEARWTHPPFAAEVADGQLFGRGAVDMKGAVAAFVSAAQKAFDDAPALGGTLLVLLTGDEEEGGEGGMRAILRRLRGRHPTPEACLIGEPSCEGTFGQGMRLGRRGSLNVTVTSSGVQGHVAWPDRADNALHPLLTFLHRLRGEDLGPAQAPFPASSLQITAVGADSAAGNIIPGAATARLNLRFNPCHSGASLSARVAELARRTGGGLRVDCAVSGEPYLVQGGRLAEAVSAEVAAALGRPPEGNAGGGVSDGRFIHALCPVVEFGLVGDLAHQRDERVPVAQLYALERIYRGILRRYLG